MFDTKKTIPQQNIPFDRYYYTEENSPFPFHTIDNRLRAKVFKILPHLILPDYDYYIWLDANIQVKSSDLVSTLIGHLTNRDITKKDIAISPHPFRNSIYEEANFIVSSIKSGSRYITSRYSATSTEKEIQDIGPGLEGLYWCGLMVRRNTPAINAACDEWFRRNILYTNFDQLSFVDIVKKFHIDLATFNLGDFYNNKFYKIVHHI